MKTDRRSGHFPSAARKTPRWVSLTQSNAKSIGTARMPRSAKICQRVRSLLWSLKTTSWIEIVKAAATISKTPPAMLCGRLSALWLKAISLSPGGVDQNYSDAIDLCIHCKLKSLFGNFKQWSAYPLMALKSS